MVLRDSIHGTGFALPANRQRRILDLLGANGQVSASLLAKNSPGQKTRSVVTYGTLRRAASANVSTGGLVLVSPASASIQVRLGEGRERKEALGKMLATLLRKGQFIFIDVGTTNLAFARHIPDGLDITVATHDPTIASCLARRPDIELLTVGGR